MDIRWLTASLDTPAGLAGVSNSFWRSVTSTNLWPPRGDAGGFATLVPQEGDAVLRTQAVGDGPPRVHLDIHVDDDQVPDSVHRATRLGATLLAWRDASAVLESPGGLKFCMVPHGRAGTRPPAPVRHPGGARSIVDQVCIDAPACRYPVEAAFWAELTGWARRPGARQEFEYLPRPPRIPLRLLLQRLGPGEADPVRAHLDLACDDVAGEVHRHETLGAVVVRRTSMFTTMRDPTGRPYCVTSRDPATGTALG